VEALRRLVRTVVRVNGRVPSADDIHRSAKDGLTGIKWKQ